jgi:hypothetical protein
MFSSPFGEGGSTVIHLMLKEGVTISGDTKGEACYFLIPDGTTVEEL